MLACIAKAQKVLNCFLGTTDAAGGRFGDHSSFLIAADSLPLQTIIPAVGWDIEFVLNEFGMGRADPVTIDDPAEACS